MTCYADEERIRKAAERGAKWGIGANLTIATPYGTMERKEIPDGVGVRSYMELVYGILPTWWNHPTYGQLFIPRSSRKRLAQDPVFTHRYQAGCIYTGAQGGRAHYRDIVDDHLLTEEECDEVRDCDYVRRENFGEWWKRKVNRLRELRKENPWPSSK